jgi:hypothetical protein
MVGLRKAWLWPYPGLAAWTQVGALETRTSMLDIKGPGVDESDNNCNGGTEGMASGSADLQICCNEAEAGALMAGRAPRMHLPLPCASVFILSSSLFASSMCSLVLWLSHCKYPFHAARGTERISCFGLPRSRDRIPQIRRVQPPTPPHQSPFVPRFPHSFLFSPTMNPLRYIFFLAFGIASQGSP